MIKSYKYTRRSDIDSALRLKIGLLVFYFNYRGQVTELSRKYSVCRTFIYELKNRVGTSDEVYMIGHHPVLVTVDPVSDATLRMKSLDYLTKEAWSPHWSALQDAGIQPLGLVRDEGVVMKAAHQESHADIEVQTYSFHAVILMQNAVSKEVKIKRERAYQEACQATLEAIERYENFQFLYTCLYQQLNCFDYQYNARNKNTALEEMKCALNYMKQLNIVKLNKEIKTIEKLLPNLLNC